MTKKILFRWCYWLGAYGIWYMLNCSFYFNENLKIMVLYGIDLISKIIFKKGKYKISILKIWNSEKK